MRKKYRDILFLFDWLCSYDSTFSTLAVLSLKLSLLLPLPREKILYPHLRFDHSSKHERSTESEAIGHFSSHDIKSCISATGTLNDLARCVFNLLSFNLCLPYEVEMCIFWTRSNCLWNEYIVVDQRL